MSRKQKNFSFSSSVLQLKFMKKTLEKFQKRKDEEENHSIFKNHVAEEKKTNTDYIIESSWTNCEGAKFDRLSYQGMNPEIERLMEENRRAENSIRSIFKEENVDVTAEEMAQELFKSRLSKTVEKKFNTKKRRSEGNLKIQNKKPKFLKPEYD